MTMQSGVQLHFSIDRIQEASYPYSGSRALPTYISAWGGGFGLRRLNGSMKISSEIVNQLNRGVALVSDRRELDQIAELNAKAGRRAKTSAANAMALSLFHTGASLSGKRMDA